MRYYPTRGDGLYGRYPGHPITLAMIGDSSAAGYGTSSPDETPGVLLACGLAELAQRPVRLVDVSKTGAKSIDLAAQVDTALLDGPHVAAILIGVNDVKAQVPPSASVRLLEHAVRRLRAANCEVVVGTCPDLGVVRPIMPPLRQVARTWSQRLAAAQTIAVVEAGGRTVSMGSLLSEAFRTNPSMWGPDNFHPSVTGYAAAAAALLPSVAAAVGVGTESFSQPECVPRRSGAADRRSRRTGRSHRRHRGRRSRGGRPRPRPAGSLGPAPAPPPAPQPTSTDASKKTSRHAVPAGK